MTITPSIGGGGGCNVLLQDADHPDSIFVGVDVGRVSHSGSAGLDWFPASAGMAGRSGCAALAQDPTNHQQLYAGCGIQGTVDGFYGSPDLGGHWSKLSAAISFAGNGNIPGYQGPRVVGRLIIPVGSELYAASFTPAGLYASGTGGTSWAAHGLAGKAIRGLAQHPTIADTLFCGLHDAGGSAFGIYTVDASGTETHLSTPAAIRQVEEFRVCPVHQRIYAACNTAGVWFSDDFGGTWTQSGSLTNLSKWAAMDLYHDPVTGKDLVAIGCHTPQPVGGGGYGSIYSSADAGRADAVWTCRTPAGSVATLIAGTSIDWFINTALPNNRLGRQNNSVHSILIDPTNPLRVWAIAQTGVYLSLDGMLTWAPAVNHLGVTAHRLLAINRADSNHADAWSDDFERFATTDGWVTFIQETPGGLNNIGGVDIDENQKHWTAGQGGGPGNKLLSAVDPPPFTWNDESGAALPQLPLSILKATDSHGDMPLVPVGPSGVARRSNGAWGTVAGPPFDHGPPVPGGGMIHPPVQPGRVGSVLALFDPWNGVYKSLDGAAHWFRIWNRPVSLPSAAVNKVECDAAGRLYVLVDKTLYRIDGWDVNDASKTVDNGGLVAVQIHAAVEALDVTASGVVVIATTPVDGAGGDLLRSFDHGASWASVDEPTYAACSANVEAIRANDDGTIHLGTNGQGILVVKVGGLPKGGPDAAGVSGGAEAWAGMSSAMARGGTSGPDS